MTAITVERAQAARPAQNFVVVVFGGVSMGIMSFAFGVFDMAKHYGVLPDLDLQVAARPGWTWACTCCAGTAGRPWPTAWPGRWWYRRTGPAGRPSTSSPRCPP